MAAIDYIVCQKETDTCRISLFKKVRNYLPVNKPTIFLMISMIKSMSFTSL